MRLIPYLKPGDGVLDIGANNGEYSRAYAAAVGPIGYVLGVEPHPRMAGLARACSGPWPWVTIMCMAVADRMGERTLYVDLHSKRHSLWSENRPNPLEEWAEAAKEKEAGPASYPTHTVTLDWLATMVPNLKAIKIDAQGAEAEILAGGTRTLRNTGLTWDVELWPVGLRNAGSSVEHLARVFDEAGWVPIGQTWDAVVTEAAGLTDFGSSVDVILQHRDRRE